MMIRTMVPWRERLPKPLSRLEEEMESLMERLFSPEEGWLSQSGCYIPRIDFVETDTDFEILVDLPGVNPDDVDVEIRNGSLWISGEKEEKRKTYHRIERRHGAFRRTIPLVAEVDEGLVKAEYKEGVLTVTIPKALEDRVKHIPIKT